MSGPPARVITSEPLTRPDLDPVDEADLTPEFTDHFWANPFGVSFRHIRVSDLLLVNHEGQVVQRWHPVNTAAFAIHSAVHQARPEVIGAAHSHSLYGKALSATGQYLEPLTQDACAFCEDHGLFDNYTGVVTDPAEGRRIALALGSGKAVILRSHGLLTAGATVDAAAWFQFQSLYQQIARAEPDLFD